MYLIPGRQLQRPDAALHCYAAFYPSRPDGGRMCERREGFLPFCEVQCLRSHVLKKIYTHKSCQYFRNKCIFCLDSEVPWRHSLLIFAPKCSHDAYMVLNGICPLRAFLNYFKNHALCNFLFFPPSFYILYINV